VWAIGLEGSFRYLEYDWVCKAGEFITETPGTAHTLVTDDPNGMKALFHMQGANEFYDENGNHVETLDVWWFINHYESHCREHGLAINKSLYL
jgi:2,4'-dihydroxyacetophenone dioxygenase